MDHVPRNNEEPANVPNQGGTESDIYFKKIIVPCRK